LGQTEDPAGQLRCLPNPTRHEFLVELVVLVDVEVARVLVLGLAGGTGVALTSSPTVNLSKRIIRLSLAWPHGLRSGGPVVGEFGNTLEMQHSRSQPGDEAKSSTDYSEGASEIDQEHESGDDGR
jgi:hypothetical protein